MERQGAYTQYTGINGWQSVKMNDNLAQHQERSLRGSCGGSYRFVTDTNERAGGYSRRPPEGMSGSWVISGGDMVRCGGDVGERGGLWAELEANDWNEDEDACR